MNEEKRIHPLTEQLLQEYFQTLSLYELQQVKIEINQEIEEGINGTYWRNVRVHLGEEITKKRREEEMYQKSKKSRFELLCEEPLKPLQQIFTTYEFIETEQRSLHPKVHCRIQTLLPKTKYSYYSGKSNPITDGYSITLYLPQYTGKVSYTLSPHPSNHSQSLLTIHPESLYASVQFIIENKQIETSHKKGYQCFFEYEFFHLSFSFKKEFQEYSFLK